MFQNYRLLRCSHVQDNGIVPEQPVSLTRPTPILPIQGLLTTRSAGWQNHCLSQ